MPTKASPATTSQTSSSNEKTAHLKIEAKGEAEPEADTNQQYTDRRAEAVNTEGKCGNWENIGIIFLEDIPKLKERLGA